MEQPRKRRVLVVSQHYWPENFRINDVVDGFVDHGIEVDVLCGLPNYPKGEWFDGYRYTGPRRQSHSGADIFRSGEIRRKNNTSLRIFLNYCSFPFFALFNLPRLRGRRYDAVFCYETSPVMMILPAIAYARTHKVPLTTYVLDLWPDNLYSVLPVKSPLLRKIARSVSAWHYKRCDQLVALSEEQAALLRDMTAGGRVRDIAIIPQYSENFYAEDTHDAALCRRYETGKSFNILFAGNISPAQDLENLVRAMRAVRGHPAGQNARVLILGDGMSRADLEAYIKEQSMEDAFLFCGSVPPTDIPRWTGMADALFAGLSKSENLGMTVPAKIASYLAAGKPILAAMDGAGQAAAQASGGALTSPAGDDKALAGNILKLCAMTPGQRAEMGQTGRTYYQNNYKRDTLLKKLEEFIFGYTRD